MPVKLLKIFLYIVGTFSLLIGILFGCSAGSAAVLDHLDNTPFKIVAVAAFSIAIICFGLIFYLRRKMKLP